MTRVNTGETRVPRTTLAATAAPSVPLAALTLPLSIYLPTYYAQVLGYDLASVAAAFTLVRLLDIALDPILGSMMDGAKGRWRSRRLWLIASLPLILAATWKVFFARGHDSVVEVGVWLVVLYAGYSLAVLSQLAIGAGLSPSYTERSRVYVWWQGGNVIGMMIAQFVPVVLAGYGDADGRVSVPAMGGLILALAPLTFLLTAALVPDNLHAERSTSFRAADYFALFRSRAVRKLVLVDLLLGLAFGIPSVAFVFYFSIVKRLDRSEIAVLVIAYLVLSIAAGPLWAALTARIGKHRSLACAAVLFAAVFGLVWLVPPGMPWLMTAAYSMGGIAYSAITLLPRAMMADVSDEERLVHGTDRTALLFALLVGTFKIGAALSVGLVFSVLERAGFSATLGVMNSPAALATLQLLYFAPPVCLCLASALIIWRFPLTAERHAEIQAQLESGCLAPTRQDA